jgi:2-polyprenyl-3-methyl-5-hydroxy-6-metoxy-1,4-benzoquinol methylase
MVVGIDINEKMILAAQKEDLKNQLEIFQYFHRQVQQARTVQRTIFLTTYNEANLEYD